MKNGYHIVVTQDHTPDQKVYYLPVILVKAIKFLIGIMILLLLALIVSWSFIVQRVVGYAELTKVNDSLSIECSKIDEIKYNYSSIVKDINSLKLLSTLPDGSILEKIMRSDSAKIKNHAIRMTGTTIPSIIPVVGVVTQPFITEGDKKHEGVDFSAAKGTVIKATASGRVISTKYDTYLGKVVVIDHGNGYITKYGHCSKILVKKGQNVERGAAIALVGSSGKSSGPHLHYEVIKDSIIVDPSLFY